jgi:catechol 2,3-dioxygenase-like lactoylglutathione lyase family enzyme
MSESASATARDRSNSTPSLASRPIPISPHRVADIVVADGTRINLIFNGVAQAGAHNYLLDEAVKLPGYTHAAFVVDCLDDLIAWAGHEGVAVTEGPVDWGRRITCFIRDPDGNVLEFNELKPGATPIAA